MLDNAEYWDTQANRWGVFSVPDEDYDQMTDLQTSYLIRELDPGIRSVVADMGCGIGRLMETVRERRPDWLLVGVDPSPQMLTTALNKVTPPAMYLLTDGEVTPMPTLDGAWCVLTFQHLLEVPIRRIIRTVSTALRPGGRFVTQWMIDTDQPVPSRRDVLWLLEEEGLRTLRVEDDTEVSGFASNWLWVTSQKGQTGWWFNDGD